MSRSRRKTPIAGVSGVSEKYDKRKNNRKLRKKCKSFLKNGNDLMPLIKEISDPWLMAKDGKMYIDKDSEYMRK